MIRASIGNQSYWCEWTEFSAKTIEDIEIQLSSTSGNTLYRPQYVWNLTSEYCRIILRRYSRGDSILELAQYFPGLLDAWELSNKLAAEVCAAHNLKTCRDWIFNLSDLNHYNWCFWLVGLALALEIPDDQWQRLLDLIDAEGEDVLLDRVIASRQPGRRIGSQLLHKKPYGRLLSAIDASKERQADLLREFVDHWYPELARKGKNELWWYLYGDPEKHPLEMGSYFGRWCIEAVAAVKALGLDDSQCLGHEHYPGDLLRPEGPTTHPYREEVEKPNTKSWIKRIFGG
ncbi:DUF1911 domain-containing protein [Marinobacterium sp. D7]|uniref:PoNe immunity protein domain-containing protein n=1 Tax=Marinobacterium ramblicola TaxID=2849041 RepID=UPI001C2CF97F|nr:PoNe immunity protein domain-containing protein [Marinobacterium ramblicola]MBV1789258.1 DUF1911 domain-containing protein [Marinobacterium ramblicola]